MRFTRMMTVSGGAMLTLLLAQFGGTQPRTTATIGSDWPMYRHDLAGTGYSPLKQIDTRNVAQLSRVWTYPLQSDAPATAAAGGRGGRRREFPGDADRRQRRHVSAGREPRRGARAGDRQGNLAVSGHRRCAVPARRRVLAG